MAERFPFEKRNWYPHMMPEDVAIWERFIEQFPDAYDSVEYDVKVGSVPEFVAGHDDPAMRAQAALYMRKIDVVGYKADQIDLIELKPNAGTSSLGQILGYKHLFIRDFMPPEDPKAIVITNAVRPDTGEIAHSMGVTMIVV